MSAQLAQKQLSNRKQAANTYMWPSLATGTLQVNFGYRHTSAMATGILQLRLQEYFGYDYGCALATAMGVLRLRLRAYIRA